MDTEMTTQLYSKDAVRKLLSAVPDPEIPVVSIEELGILREININAEQVEVVITPTYSGCPAMYAIEQDICGALQQAGITQFSVRTVLSPAWSSDWITEEGKDKLRAYGIAPPHAVGSETKAGQPQALRFMRKAVNGSTPVCPHCSSGQTELLSEFGSTSCKALYRCLACKEPFDYFKPY
ncbi:phenylacetic acid degradation protein PaaD [Undibacterium terreum]|uniref:Phenylacetic acid degradation protein PaaD n=2 Tax=Undibacterium terreum TaxID=1224302 RepID=A0A916V0B8_9BURK|nr:phenylacetic acid degradation protein PaaD [Undibacterium terreum]